MLDAISSTIYNYYNEIPKDTIQTIGRSALYSFTISFIIVNKLYRSDLFPRADPEFTKPLLAATVAACASLIHALTTPIFNYLFGDRDIYLHRETTKFMVNMTAVYLLFSHVTSVKTNLYSLCFFWGIPSTLVKSLFDLLPLALGLIQREVGLPFDAGAELRDFLSTIGLAPDPDSNSTYYCVAF